MNHGIPDEAVDRIRRVFSRFPEVEKVVLYGSRAKGNYRPGSDIDLTLHGRDLDRGILARLDESLDDLMLPYRIDLSIFAALQNAGLIEHIRRVGVVLYQRQTDGVRKA